MPLVVVGPEKEPALAAALRCGGADVRGWVEQDELAALYRGAAALVLPSRHEGFGIPVIEAMASGTPVVLSGDPALREVAGDAAMYADDGDVAGALERALADRERLSTAGLERARLFTLGSDGATHRGRLPKGARVKVAAVVVSHGTPVSVVGVAAGSATAGRRARA